MAKDTGSNVTIKPGSVVKLTGLRTASLNGSLGVVKRFNEGSGRYHVVKSQGTNACVGVKPENITQDSIVQPSDPGFASARLYQHVVFWPRPDGVDSIPVHSFPDWPGRGQSKVEYLRRKLGYTDLQRFTGVEGPGSAKPDFILFFDAADETSPVNRTALSIKMNLPSYEINKVPRNVQNKAPRGPCVLSYCPTTLGPLRSSNVEFDRLSLRNGPALSDKGNKRFTLEQLRETLLFQESAESRAQYRSHDNPIHRMFAGDNRYPLPVTLPPSFFSA